MNDKESMTVAEPVAATVSESVRRSGLLSQVMSLSQPDKKALIRYLRKDVEKEDAFQTDEFGRITLTAEMREDIIRAERDLEDGRCLTEADFKEKFAKWL